jgi:hypothetical protein
VSEQTNGKESLLEYLLSLEYKLASKNRREVERNEDQLVTVTSDSRGYKSNNQYYHNRHVKSALHIEAIPQTPESALHMNY